MKYTAFIMIFLLVTSAGIQVYDTIDIKPLSEETNIESGKPLYDKENAAHFRYYENESHIVHWYEWWYANVKGKEHSVITMFFTFGNLNNPMIRLAGVFIALLDEHESIEKITCYPFITFNLDYEKCNVTIAGNRFYEENGTFNINYENNDFNASITIEPKGISFGSTRNLENWQWGGWHISAPYGKGIAHVTYNNKEYEIVGNAYHDHNWGMSRKRQFNWDWSEFNIGNGSIIYGAAGRKELKGGIHYVNDTTHIFIKEDKVRISYLEWETISGFKKPTKIHINGIDNNISVDLYIELKKVYILGFKKIGKPYLEGRAYGDIEIDGKMISVNSTGFYEHHGYFT